MKLTNCINCGAPIKNGKCDYCGTEYDKKEKHIELILQEKDRIKLKIYGIEKEFYIGEVEVEPICYDTYRDITGTLVRTRQEEPKIKIELISY